MSIVKTSLRRCALAAAFLSCAGGAAAFQQSSDASGLEWLKADPQQSVAPGATFSTADVQQELQRAEMDRIGTLPVSCHGRRQHGVLYHVRGLSSGGTGAFEAYALNNASLVVGYIPGGGSTRPTVWVGARRYDLGTPAGGNGVAYGIGENGAIVGAVRNPDQFFGTVGTLWYKGARYLLRDPAYGNPGESLLTSAVAINRHGTILGNTNNAATDNNRPIVWHRGVPRVLPTLVSLAIASAINDAGYVVGGSDYPGGFLHEHAVLWTPDGRVSRLPTLGGEDSWAYDINNRGQIVGVSTRPASAFLPVLWFRGRITALPIVSGIAGAARAVNEHDQIVGSQGVGVPSALRALTWYGRTVYQLDTLLDDESRGIVINDAQDINDKGQILATTILSSGISQPLLLTPRPCYRR